MYLNTYDRRKCQAPGRNNSECCTRMQTIDFGATPFWMAKNIALYSLNYGDAQYSNLIRCQKSKR